jgi:hypothetical protein
MASIMDKRQRLIAVHEAGHAVAWTALGVPIDYLTIVADANSDGHCQRSDFTGDSSRRAEFIARDLIGLIAGPVAMHSESMRVVDDDPPTAVESEAFKSSLAESTATAKTIYTPVTDETSDDSQIETILRASETIARVVDRLSSLRSSNESVLPPEVARAVEAMPTAVVDRLGAWDIIPAERVAASRPLVEHIADFHAALLARGNTAKHASVTTARVASVFTACGFKGISDISASKVQIHVAGLRKDMADAAGNARRGKSVATSNYILRDAKAFMRWMVQDGRCHENPLAHLKGMNTSTDRRHDGVPCRLMSFDGCSIQPPAPRIGTA